MIVVLELGTLVTDWLKAIWWEGWVWWDSCEGVCCTFVFRVEVVGVSVAVVELLLSCGLGSDPLEDPTRVTELKLLGDEGALITVTSVNNNIFKMRIRRSLMQKKYIKTL